MTVNQSEYRQAVGLDNLYVAEVTQDDVSGYVTGTPKKLAPVATAKASPKTDSQVQYFDDGPFDEVSAEGATDLELDISNLAAEDAAWLLGQEFHSAAGRVYDDADPAQAPYFALGFRSKKSNGSYRYYWYNKIRFSRMEEEYATQSDKADPKKAKLKASALKTIYKFTYPSAEVKGCKRIWGDDDTDNFSETGWFSAVQTPTSASPSALTCTPSPVDGATSVAVSANVVLTFSNRIRTGNAGILVSKNDGTVVAATYSWNAAGTVLTIDPNSNLSASSDYIVALSGVTDIYGQLLANTVYNFTTA
jgi:phi13 family phage major tail protein